MAGYCRGRSVTAVGWKALLEWVNDLLQLQLTQVEQCASGAVYCQILETCYPGSIEMSKVNWMAKAEHEYIPNYKILQTAFDTNGISRHFPVGELIRGKFRDNFEMLQWMKSLWDRIGTRTGDEPTKSRDGKQLPPWAQGFKIAFGCSPRQGSRSTSRQREQRLRATPTPCRALSATAKVDTWRSGAAAVRAWSAELRSGASTSRARSAERSQNLGSERSFISLPPSRSASPDPEMRQRVAAQDEEIALLRQERDFYFKKLTGAEALCNSLEASDDAGIVALVKQFQQILYKDDEEEDVVEPVAASPLALEHDTVIS